MQTLRPHSKFVAALIRAWAGWTLVVGSPVDKNLQDVLLTTGHPLEKIQLQLADPVLRAGRAR